MDPYLFALTFGGAGLIVMAITGVAHLGTIGHGHTGGDRGLPAIGHSHAGPHAPAAHDPGGHVPPLPVASRAHIPGAMSSLRGRLLTLASPRVLFSVLLGFWAAGLAAQHLLAGAFVPIIAVLGGIVFERALVTPLWNVLFRFASAPAVTLDTALFSEARATSGFDGHGEGVVALEVDGQVVQCLGTLRPADRALGVRVRAGDRLRVEEVDTVRQRCIVSYLGHAVPADLFPY